MKRVAAVLSFLLMWFLVSILCGLVMGAIFRGSNMMYVGIGFSSDWRTWPGTVLGILAGIHSAKAALNPKQKKKTEKESLPTEHPDQ